MTVVDKPISLLDPLTNPIQDTDQGPLARAGSNFRWTFLQLFQYIIGKLLGKTILVVESATDSPLATCTYSNGTSGVGATLTRVGNGAIGQIGGYTPVNDKKVLIKDQANPAHNGVYVVTQIGSVSTPWILTRDTSSDAAAEFIDQAVIAKSGTQAGTWVQLTQVVTVGTDQVFYSSSANGSSIIYVTRAQFIALQASNSLKFPRLYQITDRGDMGLILETLSSNSYDLKNVIYLAAHPNWLIHTLYGSVSSVTSAGEIKIWNNRVWESLNGVDVSPSDNPSEWVMYPYTSSPEYVRAINYVEYDIYLDNYFKRYDPEFNVTCYQGLVALMDVNKWQWGNSANTNVTVRGLMDFTPVGIQNIRQTISNSSFLDCGSEIWLSGLLDDLLSIGDSEYRSAYLWVVLYGTTGGVASCKGRNCTIQYDFDWGVSGSCLAVEVEDSEVFTVIGSSFCKAQGTSGSFIESTGCYIRGSGGIVSMRQCRNLEIVGGANMWIEYAQGQIRNSGGFNLYSAPTSERVYLDIRNVKNDPAIAMDWPADWHNPPRSITWTDHEFKLHAEYDGDMASTTQRAVGPLFVPQGFAPLAIAVLLLSVSTGSSLEFTINHADIVTPGGPDEYIYRQTLALGIPLLVALPGAFPPPLSPVTHLMHHTNTTYSNVNYLVSLHCIKP